MARLKTCHWVVSGIIPVLNIPFAYFFKHYMKFCPHLDTKNWLILGHVPHYGLHDTGMCQTFRQHEPSCGVIRRKSDHV
jgi:hypothetical protein